MRDGGKLTKVIAKDSDLTNIDKGLFYMGPSLLNRKDDDGCKKRQQGQG